MSPAADPGTVDVTLSAKQPGGLDPRTTMPLRELRRRFSSSTGRSRIQPPRTSTSPTSSSRGAQWGRPTGIAAKDIAATLTQSALINLAANAAGPPSAYPDTSARPDKGNSPTRLATAAGLHPPQSRRLCARVPYWPAARRRREDLQPHGAARHLAGQPPAGQPAVGGAGILRAEAGVLHHGRAAERHDKRRGPRSDGAGAPGAAGALPRASSWTTSGTATRRWRRPR